MAKVIFGQGAGKVKGKVGNAVYQQGRNGYIMRNFAVPKNPQTAAQKAIRGQFTTIAKRWSLLTVQQIVAWNTAADLIKKSSKTKSFGEKTAISGKAYFQEINGNLLQAGQAITDNPPLAGDVNPKQPSGCVIDVSDDSVILSYAANPTIASYILISFTPTLSRGTRFYKGRYKKVAVVTLSTTAKDYTITTEFKKVFGSVPAVGSNVVLQVKNISTTGENGETSDVPLTIQA